MSCLFHPYKKHICKDACSSVTVGHVPDYFLPNDLSVLVRVK